MAAQMPDPPAFIDEEPQDFSTEIKARREEIIRSEELVPAPAEQPAPEPEAAAPARAPASGRAAEPAATAEPDAGSAQEAAAAPKADEQAVSTQVVVVGLISVASIANFKRQLGRLPGVNSVGVSSGPDGEFIFTVSHGEDVSLDSLIPTLPAFQARVVSQREGQLNVSAHDPEAEG
jgi:hypothetical protein